MHACSYLLCMVVGVSNLWADHSKEESNGQDSSMIWRPMIVSNQRHKFEPLLSGLLKHQRVWKKGGAARASELSCWGRGGGNEAATFLPRDRQQVANFWQSLAKTKDAGVLYSILLECKLPKRWEKCLCRMFKQHHSHSQFCLMTGKQMTWFTSATIPNSRYSL